MNKLERSFAKSKWGEKDRNFFSDATWNALSVQSTFEYDWDDEGALPIEEARFVSFFDLTFKLAERGVNFEPEISPDTQNGIDLLWRIKTGYVCCSLGDEITCFESDQKGEHNFDTMEKAIDYLAERILVTPEIVQKA